MTNSATTMSGMFKNCSSLRTVSTAGWDLTTVSIVRLPEYMNELECVECGHVEKYITTSETKNCIQCNECFGMSVLVKKIRSKLC